MKWRSTLPLFLIQDSSLALAWPGAAGIHLKKQGTTNEPKTQEENRSNRNSPTAMKTEVWQITGYVHWGNWHHSTTKVSPVEYDDLENYLGNPD